MELTSGGYTSRADPVPRMKQLVFYLSLFLFTESALVVVVIGMDDEGEMVLVLADPPTPTTPLKSSKPRAGSEYEVSLVYILPAGPAEQRNLSLRFVKRWARGTCSGVAGYRDDQVKV